MNAVDNTSQAHVTADREKGIVTASIEFTWSPSWDDFKTSTVRYEIEPTSTGSRLTVTHSGFADRKEMADAHGEGWVRVFGWLKDWISK